MPPRLTLLTPVLADDAGAYAPALAAACAAGDVAAVVLRLAPADDRTLVNRIKALALGVQAAGAAALVAVDGPDADLATLASRGGADGVHADAAGEAGLARLRRLRAAMRDGRIVGAGRLRDRDGAMGAGEAGADYLMFGDPRPDGSRPEPDVIAERAAWWAEIFETPCVAVAAPGEPVADLAATGAEFIGLLLGADPAAEVAAATAALAASPSEAVG